jgi:hypothetical protein
MFGLSKKTKSATEAETDFERDTRDAMTRARMAKVPEARLASILSGHADGVRRAQIHARDMHNIAPTPVMYDSYGNRLP